MINREVAEIADRLEAAGLDEAAQKVRAAARVTETDPLLAETLLHEAADSIMELNPVYSRAPRRRLSDNRGMLDDLRYIVPAPGGDTFAPVADVPVALARSRRVWNRLEAVFRSTYHEGMERACETCGGSLEGKRRDARFCSSKCRAYKPDRQKCIDSAEGECEELAFAKKLCKRHYMISWYRTSGRGRRYWRASTAFLVAGWSEDEFLAALEAQDWRCPICDCEMTLEGQSVKRAVLDHCHVTNRPRKIICSGCNRMLGFAQDDPSRLVSAAAYLMEFAVPD